MSLFAALLPLEMVASALVKQEPSSWLNFYLRIFGAACYCVLNDVKMAIENSGK